jgi:hypothetical protein
MGGLATARPPPWGDANPCDNFRMFAHVRIAIAPDGAPSMN